MTPADILAIQTELRRIADSFDTEPPLDRTCIQSAVIVDDDSAFSLILEFEPY